MHQSYSFTLAGLSVFSILATTSPYAQSASSSVPEPAQRSRAVLQPSLVVPDEEKKLPYMNPKLPTGTRVNDLLKRMTLEEKASQPVNQSRGIDHLGVPPYDWWSEARHGDGFPRAYWAGRDLRSRTDQADGRCDRH